MEESVNMIRESYFKFSAWNSSVRSSVITMKSDIQSLTLAYDNTLSSFPHSITASSTRILLTIEILNLFP